MADYSAMDRRSFIQNLGVIQPAPRILVPRAPDHYVWRPPQRLTERFRATIVHDLVGRFYTVHLDDKGRFVVSRIYDVEAATKDQPGPFYRPVALP